MQKLAQEHNLPIEETTQKIDYGWEGKPKGLLRVLWERGFINTSKLSDYMLNGRQDAFGMSLKFLMSNCQDFEEEESQLQSMRCAMGLFVNRMPKYHCEVAGEGIEYSWGCSKIEY